MKPILFRIFDFPVPSYSVMMALGYALALLCLFAGLPRMRTPLAVDSKVSDRAQIFDLFIVMVVSSLLGSKIAHVLFEAPGHIDEAGHKLNSVIELLKADPWHWARLGEGGFVWYGGLVGALGTAVYYFRQRPALRALAYSDLFAPAIATGLAIGRLGCFLAGCCFGKPTDSFAGVKFPDLPHPVHPTQLYESAVGFLLFGILFYRLPRRRFDGEGIALWLIIYPIWRFTNEFFRGDDDRGFFGPLSTSQLISIPLLGIGLWLFFHGRKTGVPPLR